MLYSVGVGTIVSNKSVSILTDPFTHRTAKDYEEMYACGTGGIAMCIAYLNKHNLYGTHVISLVWQYGVTKATITRDGENSYSNVKLTGHSRCVYTSTVDTEKFKNDFTFFQNDNPHNSANECGVIE